MTKDRFTFSLILLSVILCSIAVYLWETPTAALPNTAGVQVGGVIVAETATPGVRPTPIGEVREYKVGSIIAWKRTVSRLETQEYDVVGDMIKKRIGGILGVGGESIQVHLVGTVIGRTNLSALTISPDYRSGDITISNDGESVSIVLPYPEISRPILDEAQSSFDNHQIGWFTSSDPNLWQEAHAEASTMLIEKACSNGIGEQTRLETEAQIKSILGLGFKHVYVQTRPATLRCGG